MQSNPEIKNKNLRCLALVLCTVLALLVSQFARAQLTSSVKGKLLERQGRQLISIVHDSKIFSRDLQLVTYVNTLAEKLARNANIEHEPLRYYVLEDPQVNAFAALGGTFFLNTGLILLTQNEGELASVIAHELAHHKQEHLTRLFQDSKETQVTSLLSLLVGMAIGGEDGFALAAAGQAAGVEAMIDYTLSYEREADAIGLRILLASDYHPKHAINFMKSLEKLIHQGGLRQSTIHNTHPITQERIASFEARASRYQHQAKNRFSSDFYFAKARAQALFDSRSHRSELEFKTKISKSQGDQQVANRYGYALALSKRGELEAAQREFESLVQQYPHNQWLVLGAAELKIQQNKPAQAAQILENYVSSLPINPAVVEMYTLSLLYSNQEEKAYSFIRKHISSFLKYGQLHKLLARVANKNGDGFNSYYSEAEYFYQLGKLEIAHRHLKTAERFAPDQYSVELVLAKQKVIEAEIRWRRSQS